ncbi:hypothetical protein HanPI659440_Chr09g0349621 [Helianthus annuus]|nr:hypothetical protein HanPI659440_Chr09g0349621 [Helianthus annuus]
MEGSVQVHDTGCHYTCECDMCLGCSFKLQGKDEENGNSPKIVLQRWDVGMIFIDYYIHFNNTMTPKNVLQSFETQLEKEFDLSEKNRIAKFTKNMNSVLVGTEPKTFKGFQMVYIPILNGDHYYLLFFNLPTTQILIINNIEGNAGIEERYGGTVEKMISAFCGFLSQIKPVVAAKLRVTKPVRLEFPW